MDGLITEITGLITVNAWLAPILAFAAGIVTSFTPCSMSSMPLVIGYVGGYAEDDAKQAFRYSLVFAVGLSLTTSALGVVAALLGQVLQGAGTWWYILLGILMVLMALQIWEIFNFIPQSALIHKSTKRGYFGALIAGVLGGFFASPCATPVLVVLLAIVAAEGSLVWGLLLLIFYSLGHSIILILAGTSVSFIKKLSKSEKYRKYNKVFNVLMGMLILLIGFYMFYLGF
jgi:cytochrome c biogenesis protein CcdA